MVESFREFGGGADHRVAHATEDEPACLEE